MARSSAPAATLFAVLLVTAGCGSKGTGATGTGGAGAASSSSSTGGPTSSSSTGAGGATPSSSAGTGGSTSTGTGGGITASKWPDTTATIAVLADQLPDGMTSGQQSFAATHFVGSQKLTLAISQPLRAINPKFLVLHYHLSIWQSAPTVDFIVNGTTWGNDYPTVTTHETWFWHNQQSQRIASTVDGKILMNLTDPGFAAYWESSLEQQVAEGQYDAIFFDSASPALLQAEVGGQDPRLAGTGARDTAIAEWGGETYIQGWEAWIKPLNDDLAAKGIPLIPNTGPFVTGWDDTDYSLTAGIFSEGYASTSFVETDWEASTNELLSLAGMGKIMILQNYLDDDGDVATRLYYLANYLLVKGNRTYLDYFLPTDAQNPNDGPLSWYPEWSIDLGAPMTTVTTVADLLQGGVYQRDFAKGTALVNPSMSPVTVTFGATMQEVVPQGGGPIDSSGNTPGSIMMMPVTSVIVPATGAVILLN